MHLLMVRPALHDMLYTQVNGSLDQVFTGSFSSARYDMYHGAVTYILYGMYICILYA